MELFPIFGQCLTPTRFGIAKVQDKVQLLDLPEALQMGWLRQQPQKDAGNNQKKKASLPSWKCFSIFLGVTKHVEIKDVISNIGMWALKLQEEARCLSDISNHRPVVKFTISPNGALLPILPNRIQVSKFLLITPADHVLVTRQ